MGTSVKVQKKRFAVKTGPKREVSYIHSMHTCDFLGQVKLKYAMTEEIFFESILRGL